MVMRRNYSTDKIINQTRSHDQNEKQKNRQRPFTMDLSAYMFVAGRLQNNHYRTAFFPRRRMSAMFTLNASRFIRECVRITCL